VTQSEAAKPKKWILEHTLEALRELDPVDLAIAHVNKWIHREFEKLAERYNNTMNSLEAAQQTGAPEHEIRPLRDQARPELAELDKLVGTIAADGEILRTDPSYQEAAHNHWRKLGVDSF
jgi:hypothetical protein